MYDVFLSHISGDQDAVERIARRLRRIAARTVSGQAAPRRRARGGLDRGHTRPLLH
jgi:hypothetical protein